MSQKTNERKPVGTREPFLYDLNQRHSEQQKSLVYWLGEWDVRMSEPHSDLHRLLVINGMFHLQLWHPESKTSVLTPSPITDQLFEVTPLFGGEFRAKTYSEIRSVVQAARKVVPPSPQELMDVFYAMFEEFAWHIPNAVMPFVSFDESVTAKQYKVALG